MKPGFFAHLGNRSILDPRLATLNQALLWRRAKIVCFGDSVTEGVGASAIANRWIGRYAAELRAAYGVSSDADPVGYYPAYYASTAPSGWTFGGTWAQLEGFGAGSGLGIRSMYLASGSDTATLPFNGTGLDIHWPGYSSFGSFTYQIDSGSVLTQDVHTGYASAAQLQKTLVRGLPAGSHTLNITGSGPVVLEGAFVYNGDETTGIHVYDAGHAGYDTGDMCCNATGAHGGIVFFTGDSATNSVTAQVGNVGAHGVIISAGINDYALGISSANYQTHLETLIDLVAAASNNPSIIVQIPYQIADGQGSPVEPWANYRAACIAACAARPAVFVTDWNDAIPGGFVGGANPTLDFDNVHPDDAGHEALGLLTADRILAA